MAERRTFNPLGQGSTPWRPTTLTGTFALRRRRSATLKLRSANDLLTEFFEGGVDGRGGVAPGRLRQSPGGRPLRAARWRTRTSCRRMAAGSPAEAAIRLKAPVQLSGWSGRPSPRPQMRSRSAQPGPTRSRRSACSRRCRRSRSRAKAGRQAPPVGWDHRVVLPLGWSFPAIGSVRALVRAGGGSNFVYCVEDGARPVLAVPGALVDEHLSGVAEGSGGHCFDPVGADAPQVLGPGVQVFE